MITIRTRYIFLLLLISVFASAKDVDITFEVFHAKKNYMDIAMQKGYALREKGFNCYILKGKENISLRCNDSKTTKDMQKNIDLLKSKNIKFDIINITTKVDDKRYESPNELYFGYAAYDMKNYKRALEIFEYNYKKEKNFEHAYAYSLALMKLGRYDESLNILKGYKKNKKANKLYKDVATTYMYKELNKKNYKNAHAVVDKYINSSKHYHSVIDKQQIDDVIKKGEYQKAKQLAKEHNLSSKTFDIDYMIASQLSKKHSYDKSNNILKPYISGHKEARELFYDNIIQKALVFYREKNYKEALDTLMPYTAKSKKVKNLYNDVSYNRSLHNGWVFVDSKPSSALKAFKESCKIKKDYGCYSGMMYSYYNLGKYETSLYLAKQLYATKPSDELSTMAMRSALKLGRYDEAKKYYAKIKNKKDTNNPYLLEAFEAIDGYIKTKNYTQADENIQYLKKLYPENTQILNKEMQLYMAQKQYDRAYGVANEILKREPDSTDARYTVALYSFENRRYKECVSVLGEVQLVQTYQKDMLHRCEAYDAVSNKDMQKANESIGKIKSDEIKFAFFLDVGDMFKSIDDPHALDAYKEAKKYKPNDIDIEMIYLYALKDFKKYDQLDDELKVAYTEFEPQRQKIESFEKAYQKERVYEYYKTEKYKKCYDYATQIQQNHKDREIYTLGGWCAYFSKNYQNAKEEFAKANLLFGDKTKDIYAYALSSYHLKQYDRASQALDRIQTPKDDKDRVLIASLYTDLQQQQKAKETLNGVEEGERRDAAIVAINKSHTQLFYENSASAGLYYQSQVGEKGKNRFDKYMIPVDYDYYSKANDLHIYFDGDFMYLYNGYLGDDKDNYKDYGFGTSTQEDAISNDKGFMPRVGIDYKNVRAAIGTTPLGAKMDPELTWLLSGYITAGNWLGSLKFEQKGVDETMLSFVGERAEDGDLQEYWGRVIKRGGELGISYNKGVNISLNLGYYPDIYGENVEDNSEFKATLVGIYYPEVESISYLRIGGLAIYDSYDKNSNLFTYGHGGYFSPQEFVLGGLFAQFGDIINKDFYYQVRLGLGYEEYSVDDAKKFPLHDGVVDSDTIEKGYEDGGVDYQVAAQFGYELDENFDIIGGIAFEHFNDYTTQEVSFALVYRFDTRLYTPFNTFYLNHRVDKIIPRYEVAK